MKTLSEKDEEHLRRLLIELSKKDNIDNSIRSGPLSPSDAQNEFATRAWALIRKGRVRLPDRYPEDAFKMVDSRALHSRMIYSLLIRVAKKYNRYVD